LILYGVSPIGFGHASRSAAIGLKLRDRALELEFATGGPAVGFLQSYGFKVHDIVREPVPEESGGEMKRASLWYLRYWRGYRSTVKAMSELTGKLMPNLVVGDEEFASVSLAIEKGLPHALVSDELQLGFARGAFAKLVERQAASWYSDLQSKVSNLLVPTFGTDSGNIHYMTPVVREATQARDEARKAHGLPVDSPVVLFSSSGSGIGSFLLGRSLEAFRKTCTRGEVFATTGPAKATGAVNLGVVRDNQDLIAAADLVISTAGKSTIDECASFGTPLIAIPIKNHAEQERNAAEIGFSHTDLGRLDELIPKMLGKRSQPANYSGAQRTADYLGSLLR